MYKGQAYKKAANTLKMLDYRITSGKDAKKLPGIGQKIGDKIQEILDTGGLEKCVAAGVESSRELWTREVRYRQGRVVP